jgi:hypothetical protein
MSVECRGDRFWIAVGDKVVLRHHDPTYASGTVGLRVVDTHAVFSDLVLSKLSTPE